MFVIFNLKNSHLLTFSLLTEVFFFSVLAATIRESSDKLPCIENREGFATHSFT